MRMSWKRVEKKDKNGLPVSKPRDLMKFNNISTKCRILMATALQVHCTRLDELEAEPATAAR